MIEIKRVSNGYVLNWVNATEIFKTTDELFDRLLQLLEGRTKHFTGALYGEVIVKRTKEE